MNEAAPSLTLVLIRHGETEWNRQKRIQGHLDSPLTATGVAQAEVCARRLAREHPNFDAVISSDAPRAVRTAQLLTQHHSVDIELSRALRERSFGIGEGLTYAEMDVLYPTLFSRENRIDPYFTPPEGESRAGFHARIVQAIHHIAETHRGRTALVVTHGGVLGCVYRWLHNIALDAPVSLEVPNVAYNRLRHDGAAWRIEVWGDTSHFVGLTPPTVDVV